MVKDDFVTINKVSRSQADYRLRETEFNKDNVEDQVTRVHESESKGKCQMIIFKSTKSQK